MNLPPDIPPEVVGFLSQVGYLDEDRLKPGSQVPDLTLVRLDGGASVSIGSGMPRPVVLIFGSYT